MKKIMNAIKNFKWGYLLFAVLFVGAGLAFLAFPDQALDNVRRVIGGVTVLFGGIFVALTLADRARGFRFWAKMLMGVFSMVCGGLMFFIQNSIQYLLFIAGLYMIIDSSFKLQTSIQSKRYKSWLWWVMLFLSAAGIALGTVLLRTQFNLEEDLLKASRLLGVSLMLDGAMNLLSIPYLYHIEHGTRREVEEQLRAEGALATVVDAEEKPALTRAEKKARRKEARAALKKGTHGAVEAAPESISMTAAPMAEPAGQSAAAEEPVIVQLTDTPADHNAEEHSTLG